MYGGKPLTEKECKRCGVTKSVSEFRRRGDTSYEAMCILCKRADSTQRDRELREWHRSLKTGPCADCGQTFHPVCMQWDHLPGYEKIKPVGRMGSKQRILEEIKKCELVCANCHALRTYYRNKDKAI
jgi:hypothetical protein